MKNVEEIVISARDEASDLINRVAGELGGLGDVLRKVAQTAGPTGFTLAAVGAAVGGIVLVGSRLSNTVEQLDLLSQRTGVSTERLQVLQTVLSESGADAGTIAQALTFLNRAIADQNPLLEKLGITTKDTFSALMQLSTIFANSADNGKKTAIAFSLLGRGAGDLLGVLPQVSSAFASTEERMRATGALIEEGVARKARNLDRDMDALSNNWKGFLTRMQTATVPWANAIVQSFNDIFDAANKIDNAHPTTQTGVETEIRKTQERIAALDQLVEKNRVLHQFDYDHIERLASINGLLSEQRTRLNDLLEKQKQIAGVDEDRRRLMAIHGDETPRKDSLAGVSLEDPKTDAKAEKIKELARVMRYTIPEATKLYEVLQKIADQKMENSIIDQLNDNPLSPDRAKEIKDYTLAVEEMERVFKLTRSEAEKAVDAINAKEAADRKQQLGEAAGLLPKEKKWEPTTGKEAAGAFLFDIDKMLSQTEIVKESLATVFQGLQSGFRTAMSEIVAGTATVGSVLKNIWNGIVNSILDILARLAAAAVLKVVLTAMGIPIPAGLLGKSVAAPKAASYSSPMEMPQAAQSITNIYSYDLRDAVREMTAIGSASRNAAGRVEYIGAI